MGLNRTVELLSVLVPCKHAHTLAGYGPADICRYHPLRYPSVIPPYPALNQLLPPVVRDTNKLGVLSVLMCIQVCRL